MIYIFNAKDNVLYPVIKNCFNLTDEGVFKSINDEFDLLKKRLEVKGIVYEQLKGALIPNQDKDKYETCLIIDSSQIEDCDYGTVVFEAMLPLLDCKSTYSVLCGDYIDIINKENDSQRILHSALNDVIYRCKPSRFQHSSQYFLVYFNRLTGSQRLRIVEGLYNYPWFTGFADLTRMSEFKFYISNILVHSYVKTKNTIIASHPSDYADEENINMRGFPFKENGFDFVSINEDSFNLFLSYKIESIFPDEEDVGFSFNAMFPKFDSLSKLKLTIDDKKWNQYLTDMSKDKKGKLLSNMGYGIEDKERFIRDIYKKIRAGYIFNMKKSHDALLFNVCVDMPTVNNNFRRTTIALKYQPDEGEISVITVT